MTAHPIEHDPGREPVGPGFRSADAVDPALGAAPPLASDGADHDPTTLIAARPTRTMYASPFDIPVFPAISFSFR